MCEKCVANAERNTRIKRALSDVLYATPTSADALAVDGFEVYLALCRQMETLTRAAPINGELDPEEVGIFRRMIVALTPVQRTDALRISEYVLDMARGVRSNLGQAKIQLKDDDSVTLGVTLQDGAVVVLLNGVPIERIELEPGATGEAQLDAAERAMQAHRLEHGA